MFQKQSSTADVTAFNPKTAVCRKRLFLIEDDKTLAEMYKIELENEGFLVEVFSNGKEGLKAIFANPPDLVFLDILMPKKDGFDVLKEINKHSLPGIKNIPIIVLSNLSSPDDIKEAEKLGAKDWWTKVDNTPTEIAEKIKDFFNNQK